MTREELRAHCERQIQQFEQVEKIMAVAPNDWKRYEEHKLILELLEQEPTLDKIRAEIAELDLGFVDEDYKAGVAYAVMKFNKILDKYKAESEE